MSKKLLLGLLALAGTQTVAVAQMRPVKQTIDRAALRGIKAVKLDRSVSDAQGPLRTGQPTTPPAPAAVPQPASWGTPMGFTTYDLQSNRSAGNRMAMTGNILSATWIQSCQLGSAPGYTNRGIGYNMSNDGGATFMSGASGNCPSTFGIGNTRTGWPEMVHSNGQEIVFAHTGSGIVKVSRPAGSGNWTTSAILPFSVDIDGPGSGANGTWPRAVTVGNTIHLIYCDNISGNTTTPQGPGGVINPVVYSRSDDGGNTWARTNVFLPDFDSTNTVDVGGDSYAVAANGNNVAIAAGSFGDNTLIAKSSDGGNTFTTRRIMGPYTAADTLLLQGQTPGDTGQVVTPDGAFAMVIDNSGTAHWFSGSQLVQVVRNPRTGFFEPTGSYFPDAFRGLLYWNDRDLVGSPVQVIAGLENFVPSNATFQTLSVPTDANGGRQPYNVIGPVSMPTAAYDANGDVYCIYAAGVQGTSNTGDEEGQYYRDLYIMKLTFPGGNQVQVFTPKNISRDLRNIPDGAASTSEESAFPSAVNMIMGGKMHYQWMSDFEPGNALQPTTPGPDPEVESAIMYDGIEVGTVNWVPAFVVTNVKQDVAAYVNSATAAPNPTTGVTSLNLNLKQAATARISVRNVLGQEVLRLPAHALQAGANTVALDLSGLSNGVYFYSVQADKFTLTQRVVKN